MKLKAKQVLAVLLCVLLAAGVFPASVSAAEKDDELTDTISGNALLTLDNTNPEGNDPNDTSNPYGVDCDPDGTGSGKVQVTWDELMVMVENTPGNNQEASGNIHDRYWLANDLGTPDSPSPDKPGYNKNLFNRRFDTVTKDSISYQNMNYVQSVSFDPTGTGRKAGIAYIGYDPNARHSSYSEPQYCLEVIDTANNNARKSTRLEHWGGTDGGEYKPLFNDYKEFRFEWAEQQYRGNNFLSITAGDFGLGHETVVAIATYIGRGEGVTVTMAFEYELQGSNLNLIGEPTIIDSVNSVNYITTISSAAGDINGDGIDELIIVLGKTKDAPNDSGAAKMLVYYGEKPKDNKPATSILLHRSTSTTLRKSYKDGDDNYDLSFSSPGVDVGDVDGDGVNEVVVGGYCFRSKNKGKYQAFEQQFLGVYEENGTNTLAQLLFDDPGMNAMIQYGFYESDAIHPRAAVAAVAFNGQNGKDLIFFNGEVFTYMPDAESFTKNYTPSYFEQADDYADTHHLTNGWVSDVAVGNFDHNSVGREQVYYAVALKTELMERYSFKVGMIGATYADTDEYVASVTGNGNFYSTSIDDDDYLMVHVDGDECSANVVLTACDINEDGIRLRYRGKNYIYSDPKIEAVLQAAPYFDGVQEPGSTTYAVNTSYGESDNTTVSLDWGIGFTGEVKVNALAEAKLALEVGAAFNYTWEWEDGWTNSYSSVFETTNQNTVLVQRTPIILYNYDMYDATTGEWAENAVQVPMPLGPVWSQLSIADYNSFVDEYNAIVARNKERIDASQCTYDPPVLYKIVDSGTSAKDTGEFLIYNKGNPEGYLKDWNSANLADAEKLSRMADMTLGYSGSSKTMEYDHEESHSEGEGFSGGFSINFSMQWGVGLGLTEALAGFYVSADFMRGTCHYKTTTRGCTVSGTVNDLDETELQSQGISDDIIRAYGFTWSFGRWYVNLGTGSSDPEASDPTSEENIKLHVWDNSHVPVYGYKVSNISMPPHAVDLSISYADGEFTLMWEDEYADISDGYYVYQVVNGEHVRLNDTRIDADTFSYTIPQADLDDSVGNLYVFAATSAVDLAGSGEGELQSVWSNEVFYVPAIAGPEGAEGPQGQEGKSAYQIAVENGFKGTVAEWIASLQGNGIGIGKIEKTGTSENGLIDTYTIYFTDGNTMTFTVNNGREGLSAYEIAVLHGFEGTEAQWIASLSGNGIGVDRIEKIGTSEDGMTDTYAIYYTDRSYYTFTVANGAKGDRGEQGQRGERGEKGVGIAKIEKTGVSEDGLTDTYTITYTDGKTDTFTVVNGANGQDGREGLSAYEIAVQNGFEGTAAEWVASLSGNGIGVDRIEKTGTSEDGRIDTYRICYTDGSGYTFTVTNGVDGEDGAGIASIEKTATEVDADIYSVTRDTYTITLTDGSTYSYTVTNGRDGIDGNGVASIEKTDPPEGTDPNVDTYLVRMTRGNTYTFTVRNGKDGADGKSAYDLAVENGFEGTVLEWLASIKDDGISLLGITSEAVDELTTAYTFRYSDGTTYTFNVKDGEKGNDGDKGEKGDTGEAGKDGKDGRDGTDGRDGKDGAAGPAGKDGRDGADGRDGTNGRDGVGVLDVRVNENGDLIFSLTNGSTINSGNLMDLFLSSIRMNEKGDLYIILSDGDTVSIGNFIDIFLSNGSEEFQALYYGGSGNGNRDSGPVPFADVPETVYYYDAVVWAYENDITKGTSSTTFSPLSTCTRAQVITFLWRAAGQPKPITDICPFEDVKETDYFYTPVLWAAGLGIVEGTSSAAFSPDLQCVNSQILTFLYRAVGEPDKTGTGAWYSDAWRWAEDAGLLEGTYTGNFAIGDECPRCNVVEYLYRYLAMR